MKEVNTVRNVQLLSYKYYINNNVTGLLLLLMFQIFFFET